MKKNAIEDYSDGKLLLEGGVAPDGPAVQDGPITLIGAVVQDIPVTHEGRTLPEGVDEAALETASLLFKALGDPTRLAILAHLSLGDHRVVDLTNHLGLSQSTVSAHLACLRGCGLITSRNVGRSTVHSLAYPEIMTFLRGAEDLLALTGVAVVSVIQILGPYFEAKPCLLKLSSPYLSFLARD